jgi:hypothetical protein
MEENSSISVFYCLVLSRNRVNQSYLYTPTSISLARIAGHGIISMCESLENVAKLKEKWKTVKNSRAELIRGMSCTSSFSL